jgi:hypothetical protein
MNLDTKHSPPDIGPMVPAPTPDEVSEAFGHACRATCVLATAALNALPASARTAILQALAGGTPLDITFSLKPDGAISAVSSMGATALFSIATRRDRQRDN